MNRHQAWTAAVLALLVAMAPAMATETDVAPATDKKPSAADKAAEPAKKAAETSTAAKPAAEATDKDKQDAAAVDARFNTLEDVYAARLASVQCPPPAETPVVWREVE